MMDYEAEIAVVIGKGGKNIDEAHALKHLFGYMLANDVSARDLQRRHGGQWLKGKGLDDTCPLGPWLVTADEIDDPQDISFERVLNGRIRQRGSTRQMAFPVRRLIAELSFGMSLVTGDILLTGTPSGVGFARTPPEWLQPGDELITQSARLGELRNTVVVASETGRERSA